MYKDFDALNVLRPDFEPRATHHIPEIIEIVEKLIACGRAYVANNGDVMFDVEALRNTANYRAKISTNYKRVHVLKLMKSRKSNGFRALENVERKRTKLAITMGTWSSLVGTLNVQR